MGDWLAPAMAVTGGRASWRRVVVRAEVVELSRRRVALFCWLLFVVLFPSSMIASATPAAPAAARGGGAVVQSDPNGPVFLRHDPRNLPTRVPSRSAPAEYLSAPLSTITVNYMVAGSTLWGHQCETWPRPAKASLAYATSIWGSLVKSSVPITMDACWTADLPTGTLGGSMANAVAKDFDGAPTPTTWYPIALANSLSGTDLDPIGSDMSAAFGSGVNWYFDTTGTPPEESVDFASVVLHEVAHGLGFVGTMEVAGAAGRWGYLDGAPTGIPMAYDRLAVNGSGQSLLNTTLFPNGSNLLAAQLTSENLYFDGPQAKAANGGSRPSLYAPLQWASGSSYSHLDVTYNGTPNALMTFDLASQEVVHDPGPIGLAILDDLGWTSMPTVTTLSPGSGTVGTLVTIGGTNLKGATSVRLGGTSATTFTVNSAAQITAVVPPNASSGPVSVTTTMGTATSATSFTVLVPAISIGDVTVEEGDSGTTPATFAISLSAASASTITVGYSTADGTAVAPTDYQHVSGTLTFTPGQTSKSVSVSVVGDAVREPDESFVVNLSSPTSATIADGQGVGTILDDDGPPPTISGFQPASGPAGTSVIIAGADLEWARSVTFGGKTASYSVNSATQITATVPPDGVTGPISVTTGGGTSASAASFTVTELTCPAGQFKAEYFASRTLTGSRSVACESYPIGHDWGTGGPYRVGVDNFSARWTGTFAFATSGTYTFTTTTDDGVKALGGRRPRSRQVARSGAHQLQGQRAAEGRRPSGEDGVLRGDGRGQRKAQLGTRLRGRSDHGGVLRRGDAALGRQCARYLPMRAHSDLAYLGHRRAGWRRSRQLLGALRRAGRRRRGSLHVHRNRRRWGEGLGRRHAPDRRMEGAIVDHLLEGGLARGRSPLDQDGVLREGRWRGGASALGGDVLRALARPLRQWL